MQNVFKTLQREKPPLIGKIVGVSGNREGLKKNMRYIDEDLNRIWTKEIISSGKKDSQEKREMFEIIEALDRYPEKNFTRRYFLDCHATSSNSQPYISVQQRNDNDEWAHRFPPYIVRGFSDLVKGDIDDYESRNGMTGFVFEAGQEGKTAVNNHEGMIWLALHYACGLDFEELETVPGPVKKLEEKQQQAKTFEIEYRHGLKDKDDFKMEQWFKNFQKIEKGELLAHQNGDPIYSDWDDYIFLPLYQSQGNDGFFIIEEV